MDYEDDNAVIRVIEIADTIIKRTPKIVQPECNDILEQHRWWLREADRHATGGFYDGGEFLVLHFLNSVHFDNSEIAKADRHLEDLVLRERLINLYEKVEKSSHQKNSLIDNLVGLSDLVNGNYANFYKNIQSIANDAGIAGRAIFSTDVLLPKDIMKMNYPFSHLRSIKLPPTPDDLRVLFDWEINFRSCFDEKYLIDLRYSGGYKGRGIKKEWVGGYCKHKGARNPIENWVLDIAEYNHYLCAFTTFNEEGRIDFAVKQRNMHKKLWLYKARKVAEYFSGNHPMLYNPLELYNAARRTIRRTHSYLRGLAKELDIPYHTFPPSMNP